MGYDEALADRLRGVLTGEQGLTEKRMFGGLAFLVHGRLAVSASSTGGLLLRIDPSVAESLLTDPGCPAVRDARTADDRLAARRHRRGRD